MRYSYPAFLSNRKQCPNAKITECRHYQTTISCLHVPTLRRKVVKFALILKICEFIWMLLHAQVGDFLKQVGEVNAKM